MRTITSCTFDCPDTCSVVVERDGDRVRVEGNRDHPVTAGLICSKVRRWPDRLRSNERVISPRLRRSDAWTAISWSDALDLCAENIQRLRQEPSSILHVSSLGNKAVLPLAGNLLFGRLGAGRVSGSLCDMAGIAACVADFGALDHNDILDLGAARKIVNWGKDLSRSSVHVAALVQQARRAGAHVVAVSPGGDGNRAFCDRLVRIRPGTDRFLAAAIIRLLWQRGRIDPAVLARTGNWAELEAVLRLKSPVELARCCDAHMCDVEALYELYAGPGPVATVMGYGLQRYRWGGENVRWINALALLAGHVGVHGGGSYFNVSSVRNLNLDWAQAAGDNERRTFPLPTIGPDVLSADPPVRMIWVNGCNVVNQSPDSGAVAQALEAADFVVVADAFMNDTARRADLVLPVALMWEQEDVVGSFMHNYINHAAPVFQAPDGARSDHWIFREVGRRLSPPCEIPDADCLLRASLDSRFIDVTLEELREQGWARTRRSCVAFADGRFAHADGLYRLPPTLHDEPLPPDDYPLRLLTLVRREAIHSQMPEGAQTMPPTVWLAPDSPVLQRVDRGRDVYLSSPLGRMRVNVELLPGLHPRACLYRRGDWMCLGGGANQLIAASLTDLGDGAAYYDQHVTLEN